MFHARIRIKWLQNNMGAKENLADIQCLNKRLLYNYTCYTHTIGNMLQWHKKLLWLHCANGSCALFMQIRSTQTSSTKHGNCNTWHAISCVLNIWQFNHASRQWTMDFTYCRNWARHRCGPTDLGSGKHTTLPDLDQGELSSTDYMCHVQTHVQDSRLWICRQCGSLYYGPQSGWQAGSQKNARIYKHVSMQPNEH